MTVQRVHILSVDDVPANLLAVRAVLSRDVVLFDAHSGREALEILAREPVELLLLDIQMPGMDGFEVAERARQLMGRSVPIVFITASSDPTYRARAKALGAADYFVKPYEADLLRASVMANVRAA